MKSTVAPYETSTWCIKIVCTSGHIVRLTSYPLNLTMSNSSIYETDSGYDFSDYSSNTSMSPSSIDLEGFVGIAGITREQIGSGIFDNARIYIFKCNYLSPIENYEPVTAGILGKTSITDDRYVIEGMNLIDVLSQSIGRVYSASCSRTFGDLGCKKILSSLEVTGTLTSVTSSTVVRDSTRTEPLDYFGAGTLRFTSGLNAGLKPIEVKSYAVDGTITVFEWFYYVPQIGDSYVLVPGCRKRLTDCSTKWNNIINYFGFPNIPTSSSYSQVGGNR